MTRPFSIVFYGFFTVLFLGILSPLFLHWANKPKLPSLYPAPAFALTSSESATFNSDSLQGKVWVANFFFTSCRGPCPVQSQHMSRLAAKFEHRPNDVAFVSITVDPETDTPERLKEYAARFNADTARWNFLNGSPEEINRLLNEGFKLGSVDDPIFHSTRFVLVDQKGTIRGYYQGTDKEEIDSLITAIEGLL